MRHSLISSRVFTLITLSWCLLAELLTLPFHIHQSHWYRWSPSWAVISPLSSKPSENMDRMAVCCQIPSQDTLLSSKKSQCRHRYRNTPSTAVPVWVSPSIVYFRTRLYWTLTELWAFGGSFHLAGPCKKNHYWRLFIFLTVISLTFGSHVPTLPMSSTPGSLPNQCQLTLTEKDPWMDPSPLSKPSSPTSPLPCPVWSVSDFPSLAHSVFWGSDFSFLILLPPLLALSQTILHSPIWLFQFGLCYFFLYLHLSVFFPCMSYCLKYVWKLARNCHQRFTQNMARS